MKSNKLFIPAGGGNDFSPVWSSTLLPPSAICFKSSLSSSELSNNKNQNKDAAIDCLKIAIELVKGDTNKEQLAITLQQLL